MGRGKEMKFIISFVFVLMVIGCASSTKVEIEPGESAQIIIIEPKKKERWGWKMREYLRLERQKVKEEDKK